MKQRLAPYLPGIILLIVALVIGCLTYQDYGVAWDECAQRQPGLYSYEYVFEHSNKLFTEPNDYHGAGFELPLMVIEKKLHLTATRDIYLMRHLVTHIFYLLCAFCGYVLLYRVFKNKWLATLGFAMLVFMPRIYAHTFFNTKDIPFMGMFIVVMALSQIAFEKRRALLFLLLGLAVGYTTSIRIMGVMIAGFLFAFLAVDAVADRQSGKKVIADVTNGLLMLFGFCVAVYVSWPYLWPHPVSTFVEAFHRLSHYDWEGTVLYMGRKEESTKLSWFYLPVWFGITMPVIWLILGLGGALVVVGDFFRKPLLFICNHKERSILLALLCFITPVIAVIFLHSVVYDDWRHVYFIYPGFVILAIYALSKMKRRLRIATYTLMAIQWVLIAIFMIGNHPFHQLYFNELVSHKKDYLRTHYEMDYWGTSVKKGLDYLVQKDHWGTIKIHPDFATKFPLGNNIYLLPERDQQRVQPTPEADADYMITFFRGHPEDYPYKPEYSVQVENSTIMCIYKLK